MPDVTGTRGSRAERRRRVVAAVIVFAMVLAAGATRVAVVRAVLDARDPAQAASDLLGALRGVPA